MKRFIAILMTILLIIASLPVYKVDAAAYDPVTKTEGSNTLDLRFWEDQKPDIGFYINAGNRYLLESVPEPQFGTSSGEWSVMDLLRGYYTGADYLNYVPENYYENYLERVERYVIAKAGNLDNNKSTEWSRSTLSLSALGKDIRSVGEAGDYLYVKFVSFYKGEKTIDTGNIANNFALKLYGDIVVFDQEYGVEFDYTSQRTGKAAKGFAIVPAGTYTLDRETMQLYNEQNELVTSSFTEMYSAKPVTTHEVSTVTAKSLLSLPKPYDYVERLSKDYAFSYRQGINGPIWILIAMDTGGYELYTKEELAARGIEVTDAKINTKGKLIDYILNLEITMADGRVGGWALGTKPKTPDPDITMMAVQSLAPYYLDEEKFKNAYRTTLDSTTQAYFDVESESFKQKYINFKKAVERAVVAMAEDQQPNGAFKSMNITNSESTVQVIVGLTALGIDPLSDNIYLPTIDQTVSFIKEGGEYDGVWTNNMVDALIAFWSLGSGSSPEVGGFKHVATGNDSGGGAGTTVNGMATDQAIYGLIAYDRFLKKKNRLYDMTDMINGEYKTIKAQELAYTYSADGAIVEQGTFSPYEVLTIPEPPARDGYKAFWTTQPDGTGAVYYAGEKLSTPDHAITLYAQYVVPYEITYELNDGQWLQEDAEQYAPATRTLTLPTAAHIQKDNHVFYGWYATPDFQGEAVTVIDDPTQLQHTLYAKWVSYETLIANAESAIATIPAEAQLTTADAATVQVAREAYNAVPAVVVDKVTGTDVLTRAEDVLKVLAVEDKIAALPEKLNLTHMSRIEEVTTAIHALPGSLQVEIKNLTVYQEKLSVIQQLQQQATDIDYAEAVRTLINALPKDITVAHEAQLKEAVTAYNRLTASQKELLAMEYITLSNLEYRLNTLLNEQKIEQIKSQIAALPAVNELTLEKKDVILALYEEYLALSYEVKQSIDQRPLHRAVSALIDLQINNLPTTVTEADRATLNDIRYLYEEADYTIQNLVTSYKKLEQAFVTLENAPLVQKANEVIAKINLIPANVTITAKSTIETARAAYESLTAAEKAFVTNASKLTQAENTLKTLENALKNDVTQLVNAINQLPATITLTHKSTVTALQNSYNALSATAKAQVTNYQTLVNAVQAIASLEAQDKQIVQAMQAAITALPEVASITINHQLIIEDVRTKYNSLTATQKAGIDTAKLVAAEAQLQKLLNVDSPIEKPADVTDKTNNGSVNPPISSDQLVTETDERLIVQAISNGSESIATITPNWIQSLTVPSIEVDTNTGIRVIVPKNAVKQYTKPIQVATKIHQRGTERSIDVTFGTMDGTQYIARRSNMPFTIRIPASVFMAPQASTTALAFEPGVILGYSADKGYYAVPHIYENGEFIVTASEGHTLVHRTEQITFDDIQGSIFQDEIEYLASRFVIKGYDDANFRPEDKITRGQFAALISRALDLKPTKATTFRDGFYSEFRDDMQAVYEAGIMRGYSDTKFGTNEPLTREQAAATMARVLEYMDYEAKRNLVHFKDKEEIDPAFVKQIELLNTLNIMSGHADGSFKPKDQLTRGQLAKILQRTLAVTKVM